MSSILIKSNKQKLRTFFINRRHQYFHDFNLKNNAHIQLRIITSNIKPCVIGSYLPFKNEIQTNLIQDELEKKGFEVCLPVINEKENSMVFKKYHSNEKLTKNKYGILEPTSRSEEIIPSILIVPLVAFSHEGFRLGYGGGYYDRFIEKNLPYTSLTTIGLGFSFQRYDNLPYEKHDQKLNWILTEKYLYKVA